MNYASQDTVYAWQQPIAPLALLSEESTRQQLHSDPQPIHSSSHSQNASGSSLDQRHFQPLPVSGGSAYPHYTYCTVQAALIPVQGGYQYNPAQGMLPIQGAASCRSTPFVSHGTGKECVGLANTSCHRAVGVCHQAVGVCHQAVGVCHRAVGVCHMIQRAVGVCHTLQRAVGVCHTIQRAVGV